MYYANQLAYIYAAIDSGVEISNDAESGKYVIVLNKQNGEDLDTDLESLGILNDSSIADEIDPTYYSNSMVLGSFLDNEIKTFIFGHDESGFSVMESVVEDENFEDARYAIILRIPNEEVDGVEMMPLNDLYNSINASD